MSTGTDARRLLILAGGLLLIGAASGAVPARGGQGGAAVSISVQQDGPDHVLLHYELGDFATRPVMIDGRKYALISLGTESPMMQAGAPALPTVCRSVIIPDDAEMAVKVSASQYYDIADIDVAPSKGSIPRTIDPADVPYTFGDVYQEDAFYPRELATLREPYVLRDHRGVVVELNPLHYNPVTHTLRVYTDVTLELVNVGPGRVNVLQRRPGSLSLAFHELYQRHFLNYGVHLRYPPLDEEGHLLIIAHDAWIANVQPLADHKNLRGIDTTIVGVSTIGNNSTAIRNYIQDVYDGSDLAFVLLVGDVAQVATPYAVGGASDPTYALLSGGDNYPDIMVGRFSAETAAQADTQVERSVEYEQMPATGQEWFWKGTGVASNLGIGDDGEYDNEHIDYIRDDLLAYGYTEVDQIYDPYGTAAMVSAALNEGRGIVNYCGHGNITGWGSTGFSNSHVNALINDNMLPFICSVACNNGEFDGYTTCFAEAWLRATHGSEPTGAIGCYASSISQYWDEPMDAQDEFVDMYVTETYSCLGTLLYAGSCHMMDEYGSSGVDMFLTWHLFGDPSLRVTLCTGVPRARNGYYETAVNAPVLVTLQASDCDGLPDPPGALAYIIESLPANGRLTDPGADVIDSVPYTLADGGNEVLYTPHMWFIGEDSFTFKANDGGEPPDGGDSNIATIHIEVPLPESGLVYAFPLDSDLGWTTEGQWAFGQPTGGGSHYGDPDAGHTGDNVYGYNLTGDYSNNMSMQSLTTTAIDCRNLVAVELRFWRWLGVESAEFDHATVEVSNDGSNWTEVWANPTRIMSDWSWHEMVHDISAVADRQATVYLRWTMGPTNESSTFPGWNVDDIEIWGAAMTPPCPGDLDGNNTIDLADLSILLANYGTTGGAYYEEGDIDLDGDVDLSDLSALLAAYGTMCE